jgi:hypothetical protein
MSGRTFRYDDSLWFEARRRCEAICRGTQGTLQGSHAFERATGDSIRRKAFRCVASSYRIDNQMESDDAAKFRHSKPSSRLTMIGRPCSLQGRIRLDREAVPLICEIAVNVGDDDRSFSHR